MEVKKAGHTLLTVAYLTSSSYLHGRKKNWKRVFSGGGGRDPSLVIRAGLLAHCFAFIEQNLSFERCLMLNFLGWCYERSKPPMLLVQVIHINLLYLGRNES